MEFYRDDNFIVRNFQVLTYFFYCSSICTMIRYLAALSSILLAFIICFLYATSYVLPFSDYVIGQNDKPALLILTIMASFGLLMWGTTFNRLRGIWPHIMAVCCGLLSIWSFGSLIWVLIKYKPKVMGLSILLIGSSIYAIASWLFFKKKFQISSAVYYLSTLSALHILIPAIYTIIYATSPSGDMFIPILALFPFLFVLLGYLIVTRLPSMIWINIGIYGILSLVYAALFTKRLISVLQDRAFSTTTFTEPLIAIIFLIISAIMLFINIKALRSQAVIVEKTKIQIPFKSISVIIIIGIIILLFALVSPKIKASREADLRKAVVEGDIQQVRELLNKGVDAGAGNKEMNRTPLILASINNHPEIVQAILDTGIYVDDKDNTGMTALMHAVVNNHFMIVKLLIKAEANINAMDNGHYTPLDYANELNHKEILKTLKEAKGKN